MQFGLEFLSNVCKAVLKRGGTHEQVFDALKTGNDLADKLAELIMSNHRQAESVFTVTVDYPRSLREMITDGEYDWTNSDITEKNFSVNGNGTKTIDIHLVRFNRAMSSDGVLKELGKMNLRPARIEELLALGSTYKDEQRKYPIVALGSVWRGPYGSRHVASLCELAGDRGLRLYWLGYVWGEGCRFAAASKSA